MSIAAGTYTSQLFFDNYDSSGRKVWVRSLDPNSATWSAWAAIG